MKTNKWNVQEQQNTNLEKASSAVCVSTQYSFMAQGSWPVKTQPSRTPNNTTFILEIKTQEDLGPNVLYTITKRERNVFAHVWLSNDEMKRVLKQ